VFFFATDSQIKMVLKRRIDTDYFTYTSTNSPEAFIYHRKHDYSSFFDSYFKFQASYATPASVYNLAQYNHLFSYMIHAHDTYRVY
jgi:hypothetical protein